MICAEITDFQRVPKRTVLSVRVFFPVVVQTKIRRRERERKKSAPHQDGVGKR